VTIITQEPKIHSDIVNKCLQPYSKIIWVKKVK
jgi:hypothetical protein